MSLDVQQQQQPPAGPPGVSAEDALAGLSDQMMLISETIGDVSLRCSADGRCPPHVADGVARLRVQVEEALRRVETMNETMGALRDQAGSVQRVLETVHEQLSLAQGSQLPGQDNACDVAARLSPPQDRTGPPRAPSTSTAALISPAHAQNDSGLRRGEQQQQQLQQQQQRVEGRPNAAEQQCQERPKSFRELVRERRERNELDSGRPMPETNEPRIIETLEDLVASLSHCLTGGPGSAAEYTSWLGGSLGVETVEDLAERVESSPGLLVAGNGTIGMWRKKEFCDAVRDAAARMRRR